MSSPLPRKRSIGLRVVMVVALLVGGLVLASSPDGRSVLGGIALWSLIATPIVAAGILLSKRGGGVWPFLGGSGPYEGHGPD